MGQPEKKAEINGETVEEKKIMPLGIVTDERIVDGFYFASCMRYLHNLLSDPWQLDTPPEEVVRDED